MRRTLRTVVAVAAASAAFACTGPASAATATAGPSSSSPSATCGPDGQMSMSQNTSLYNSQTPTPGHAVYSTTVITNSVGALPHAEIRMQIIPEMQGVTKQPPLPSIRWSLDGGSWHNPQASWTTDVSGSPYWLGPDLAIGTLTTGTHKIEVSFTFATGDLYGAYGADVYVDADRCSAGGDLSNYGDGYVSAAFDGPSSVAGSGSSGSGGSSGKSTSSAQESTTHSVTPTKSTPSSSTPDPTASAAASPSEAATTDEPSSTPSHAAEVQDVAARNTAAASSFSTSATLGLIILAAFAMGGFIVFGRRRRAGTVAAGTAPTVESGDRAEGQNQGE